MLLYMHSIYTSTLCPRFCFTLKPSHLSVSGERIQSPHFGPSKLGPQTSNTASMTFSVSPPPPSGRPRTQHAFPIDGSLSHAMRLQLHLNDGPDDGGDYTSHHPQTCYNEQNGQESSITGSPPRCLLSTPRPNSSPAPRGRKHLHSQTWPRTPPENDSAHLRRNTSQMGYFFSLRNNQKRSRHSIGVDREIYTPRSLPSRHLMSRYIDLFFKGTGTLIHLIQEVDIMGYFCVAYSLDKDIGRRASDGGVGLTNGEFCLLLLVAAVGAQYLEEDSSSKETREKLFNSGKWYLDIAFGRGTDLDHGGAGYQNSRNVTLLKMSASAITGLYLIFEKKLTAVDYIEQAIHLAQSRNLHRENQNLSSMSVFATTDRDRGVGDMCGDNDWESWRRIWKSLVFLDGWLSSSVGLLPITATTDLPYLSDNHANFTGYNTPNVGLQTEMAKLGLLMKSITMDICVPKEFDLGKVRDYWNQLKAWHERLPDYLRLSGALSDNADYTHKTSVLLTHCAYLGSIILLTRRVLVARIRESANLIPNHLIRDVDDFASMCLSAARQLATAVGLIFQEGRLVRKCWLGIQSAFSSCLMIFLDLALIRREQNSVPSLQDTELVSRCLAALEYCAVADSVAKAYLELLLPIHDLLILNARGPAVPGKLQRPQIIQHRSSSYSSSASASSSISRSPSASPSKRPRVLPSRVPNHSSQNVSAPTSPTYGPAFQPAGTFNRIATTNRMDQIFGSDEGMIDGADPRIHLLVNHIIECIDSPYNHIDKPFGPELSQVHYATNRRVLDPKSRIHSPTMTSRSASTVMSSPPTLNTNVNHFPQAPLAQGATSSHGVLSPTMPAPLPSVPVQSQNMQQAFLQQQHVLQQSPMQVPHQIPVAIPVQTFPIQTEQQQQTSPCAIPQNQHQVPSSYEPNLFARTVSTNQTVHVAPPTMGVGRPMKSKKVFTVANPGGPLPNVWMEEDDNAGGSVAADTGGRRRKMPFKNMEEYEGFLRRVA